MIQFYGEVKKEQHNYPEAIKELRETLEEEQPELEQYLIELWDNCNGGERMAKKRVWKKY